MGLQNHLLQQKLHRLQNQKMPGDYLACYDLKQINGLLQV